MAYPCEADGWLGPMFRVFDASAWLGPEAIGFIVQHRATELCIWTGGIMSARDAAQRLIEQIHRT